MRGLLRTYKPTEVPEKEEGDLYVFTWADGSHIAAAIGRDVKEAKKKVWRDLGTLGHVSVRERLKRGEKHKVTRIDLSGKR